MIKIIAGRLNNMNKSNYWLINDEMVAHIGDYAIVENMNGYDLVEIVGFVETDEEHINELIGNKINKKTLDIIPKSVLVDDDNA